ncbi:MAG: glycosyltransferase family 2 protein [Candidatus Buchananbacteria bacterium]|jgi:glycosyltransferase involved in cell wall biosynthesis
MNDKIEKKQVSIVIPAFNEEKGITASLAKLLEVMKATDIEFEVIVVDDGSKDKTAEIVAKLDPAEINVILQETNRGYGAALKAGIEQTKFDLIAITDADGTYPSDRLPELIRLMGDYDMVVGARVGGNVQIPLLRRLPKMILNKYANYLVKYEIPDLNSGLRVFRRDIYRKFRNLLPSGFSFTSTITMAMLSNSYRVKYVPIDYYKREGKSKIKPVRDTINFFKLVSKITLYFNPLRIFVPVTSILLLLGLLLLGYDVFFADNITDKTVLVLFLGMQFGLIGVLADIIIHQREA